MIYRHFQIFSEISVICAHCKRAISRSRYIGWETNIGCLYIPFVKEQVKMKSFKCPVSGIRLACLIDIIWDKKLFSSVSYHTKGVGDKVDKHYMQRKSPTSFPILLQEDRVKKYSVKMHVPFLQTSFFLFLYNHKDPMENLSQFLKVTQKYHFLIALTLSVQ